eukprot:TRINITY_DN2686_c0_g1_i1.p1 TRINITY_DN2686_c0_g1~~TRINITY_DN2686_c0_g1_i1.p1  ORF type:complete len:637 (-),score=114.52 TRINITY_DN2686_c0_g1_i1:127-2010(-)
MISAELQNTTRDLSDPFFLMRELSHKEKRDQTDWLMNRLKIIKGSSQANTERIFLPPDTDSKICCTICLKYFGLLNKKIKCPLCVRSVCHYTCSRKIPMNLDPFSNDQNNLLRVCINCAEIFEKRIKIKQQESRRYSEEESDISQTYDRLNELRSWTESLLPKLKIQLEDLQLPSRCSAPLYDEAQKAFLLLDKIFLKLKNMLQSIKPNESLYSKQKLVNNMKTCFALFLQSHLPQFKLLKEQFRAIKRPEQPSLTFIDPAVCSLSGGRVIISGENLTEMTCVKVAGLDCPCKLIGNNQISVQCPTLLEEGFKTVELINPGGLKFQSEGLLYTDKFSGSQNTNQNIKSKNSWSSLLPTNAISMVQTASSYIPQYLTYPQLLEWRLFNKNTPPTNTEPIIYHISPAVTPLVGKKIEIIGKNFEEGVSLLIDGKPQQYKLYSDQQDESSPKEKRFTLSFTGPSREQAGFVSVEVVNPSGERCKLDNVLYYSDEINAFDQDFGFITDILLEQKGISTIPCLSLDDPAGLVDYDLFNLGPIEPAIHCRTTGSLNTSAINICQSNKNGEGRAQSMGYSSSWDEKGRYVPTLPNEGLMGARSHSETPSCGVNARPQEDTTRHLHQRSSSRWKK